MKKKILLTNSELEIMQTLWNTDHPLTHLEINEQTPDKSFTGRSIFQLLTGLIEKGMIEIAGVKKTGKKYSRTFIPCISAEEYTFKQLKEIQHDKSASQVANGLLCAFFDNTDDENILNELELMIQERKKGIHE